MKNMFCGKCGEKINDGAMFCGNCGAPVNQGGAANQDRRAIYNGPLDQGRAYGGQVNQGGAGKMAYSGSSKISKMLLPIVIAVAVCIVAIFVYNQNFAYKKIVRQYSSAVEKLSVEKAIKCMPKDVLNGIEEQIADDDESLDDYLEEMQDEIDDTLSDLDDYSIKVDTTKVEKCDQDEIDDVVSMYKDEGIRLKISKMKSVTLNVEITASYNGEENIQDDDMVIKVGKIGGKWYVVDADGSPFDF